LFVRSYGIDILTSGRSGLNRSDAVRNLLNRNRCNLMFAERTVIGLRVQGRWVPRKAGKRHSGSSDGA
jgi:hypothetical protein